MFGQRYVGATCMLSRERPFRFAMTNKEEAQRHVPSLPERLLCIESIPFRILRGLANLSLRLRQLQEPPLGGL